MNASQRFERYMEHLANGLGHMDRHASHRLGLALRRRNQIVGGGLAFWPRTVAAIRVRHAGGNIGKARLHSEQWLLIGWPAGDKTQDDACDTVRLGTMDVERLHSSVVDCSEGLFPNFRSLLYFSLTKF